MSGLDEKTNYVVELRAFTSAGEGAPVAIAAQTGESEWQPFLLGQSRVTCMLQCDSFVVQFPALNSFIVPMFQSCFFDHTNGL